MSSDSSHSRRELLAVAGAVFGTTALAGCSRTAAHQNSTGTDDGEPNETAAAKSTTDEEAPVPTEMDGLVTVEREASVADVVAAISGAIEDNESLTLMTRVDHAENAASVDRSLPPTTLLLFGNPELGTQLMTESRTVAIDLPQKLLAYEDDDGTFVVYNDPEYLARRHEIAVKADVLEKISGALDTLANAPVESTESE